MIETDIKNGKLVEESHLRRNTAGEVVIHENDLVQCLPHLANASRNTTTKIVVSKYENRNRGVAQIFGDSKPEPVIIEENGV